MKKIILVLIIVLLVGCSNDLEDRILTLEEAIETKDAELVLVTEKKDAVYKDYLEAVDDYEKSIADLETKDQEIESLTTNISDLMSDNEALLKRLTEVEFDSYEAQINYDINIIQTFNGRHRYVLEPSIIPHAQIYNVIGYKPELSNISDANGVTIDLGEETYEVVSFLVEGEIFNFKWSSIEWDDSFEEYTIGETIQMLDGVKDQRVNIHTTLPEGLPSEMVTFENSQGQVFEFFMSYDGFGFEGVIVITE